MTTSAPIHDSGIDMSAWRQQGGDRLREALKSSERGLSEREAQERRRTAGLNLIETHGAYPLVRKLLSCFRNPLVLLLLAASVVAAFTGDVKSCVIITTLVIASVIIDAVQERSAERSIERLRASVVVRSRVLRDGAVIEVPAAELVPGDVVLLDAGTLIPADGIAIEARDLFVNQAVLTGESFPVEKHAHLAPASSTELTAAVGALFLGTSVLSGSGRMMIVATGARTELGQIAGALAKRRPPDALEIGTRRFGMLIMQLTLLLSLGVVLVNAAFHRPWLDSFMFALALAVGLTPELLPMIVTVTLARGARRLARERVIVKRLAAVHALGSVDVICTDKTGTLTEGTMTLERHIDASGRSSDRVLELAMLNSVFESGIRSPLDAAIVAHAGVDVSGWTKLDEVPFDFERRRVSVLAQHGAEPPLLVVKGAPEDILARCTRVALGDRIVPLDAASRARATEQFEALGRAGLRVLGVGSRALEASRTTAAVADEADLEFAGFVAFMDPARRDAGRALALLARDGVAIKIVSGDNERVVLHLCESLEMRVEGVVVGAEVARLDDAALAAAAAKANVFCRVTPPQKERLIRVLKQHGHTVGFIGDGVNDAPALRVADVGISVDSAVDVAKDAADVILLRHDLSVLHRGVREGRRTYANIMKYLMMATSSNFGNMASMAVAPIVLPFLPLSPVQILLNNLLYDLSEVAIPLDRVDAREVSRPQRWDMRFIRNFMWTLGPVSSIFDLLTFYLLLSVLQFDVAAFRTGWFVESMATQVLVIFVIRTRGSPFASRPHPWLAVTSIGVVAVAALLPFTPAAQIFGFVPLPPMFYLFLVVLVAAYLLLAEFAKRSFYRRRHV